MSFSLNGRFISADPGWCSNIRRLYRDGIYYSAISRQWVVVHPRDDIYTNLPMGVRGRKSATGTAEKLVSRHAH